MIPQKSQFAAANTVHKQFNLASHGIQAVTSEQLRAEEDAIANQFLYLPLDVTRDVLGTLKSKTTG